MLMALILPYNYSKNIILRVKENYLFQTFWININLHLNN